MVWILAVLLTAGALSGCIVGGSGESDEVPQQITRPSDGTLALDDPGAVAAFDTADMFMIDWFFRDNPEEALAHVSSDVRPSLESTLTETSVDGECSFVQVEGDAIDENGTTVAVYAVNGCQITPPNQEPATHLAVSVSVAGGSPWVTGVTFQR